MLCPKCKSLMSPKGSKMVCIQCGYQKDAGFFQKAKAVGKDVWIQGLQLNRLYRPHWDEIKDTFEEFGVDLNRQNPIITMQALKQVRVAKEITEKIKGRPRIRELAGKSTFPLRSVQAYGDYDKEKIIDGTIFVAVLRIIPEFALLLGADKLSQFLSNGNSMEYLEKVFLTRGTIFNTAEDIETVVKEMVKEAQS